MMTKMSSACLLDPVSITIAPALALFQDQRNIQPSWWEGHLSVIVHLVLTSGCKVPILLVLIYL